jgi:hypothetical protein
VRKEITGMKGLYTPCLTTYVFYKVIYNVNYLNPLAIIRLILLLLPLLFHSYTGTALKRPWLYQILYFGTSIVLVLHILCLCLFNPASMEALLPLESVYDSGTLMQHLHELRRIWWALLLSFISDICHLFMYWHVRSTAPQDDWFQRKKEPSAYYAIRQVESMRSQESEHWDLRASQHLPPAMSGKWTFTL